MMHDHGAEMLWSWLLILSYEKQKIIFGSLGRLALPWQRVAKEHLRFSELIVPYVSL